MKIKLVNLAGLIAVLIAVGCGGRLHRMYSGPELPQDKVCFLIKPCEISIASLDKRTAPPHWLTGQILPLIPSGGFGEEDLVELLPGSHNLKIGFTYYGPSRTCWSKNNLPLTFEGAVGHIYAINPDFAGSRKKQWHQDWFGTRHVTNWQPRIEDITNTEYANEKIMPKIRNHKAKLRN